MLVGGCLILKFEHFFTSKYLWITFNTFYINDSDGGSEGGNDSGCGWRQLRCRRRVTLVALGNSGGDCLSEKFWYNLHKCAKIVSVQINFNEGGIKLWV